MIVNNSEQAAQLVQALTAENGIVHALKTYLAPLVIFAFIISLAVQARRITDEGANRFSLLDGPLRFAIWVFASSALLAMIYHSVPVPISVNTWTAPGTTTASNKTVPVYTFTAEGPAIDGYYDIVTRISNTFADALVSTGALPTGNSAQVCTNPEAIYSNAYAQTLKQIAAGAGSEGAETAGEFVQCTETAYNNENINEAPPGAGVLGPAQSTLGGNAPVQGPTPGALINSRCQGWIGQLQTNLSDLALVCPGAKTPEQQHGVQVLAASLQAAPFSGPVPQQFYQAAEAVSVTSINLQAQALAGGVGWGGNRAVSWVRNIELWWQNVKVRAGLDTKTAAYYLLLIQAMIMALMVAVTPIVVLWCIIPTGGGLLGINLRLLIGYFLIFAMVSMWYPVLLFLEGAVFKHYIQY